MLKDNNTWMPLVGRVLIALLFVPAGWSKLVGMEGTVKYMASVGMPAPSLLVWPAIAIELVGGLMLAVGFQARLASLAIVVFTLVANFTFHNFWAMPADQVMLNQLMFVKNLAVIGGLAYVVAHGAGRWSIDAKRGW
jgi:putative oxidoreductase